MSQFEQKELIRWLRRERPAVVNMERYAQWESDCVAVAYVARPDAVRSFLEECKGND